MTVKLYKVKVTLSTDDADEQCCLELSQHFNDEYYSVKDIVRFFSNAIRANEETLIKQLAELSAARPIVKKDVEWECPHCHTENIDTYGVTAEPMCEECFHLPGWKWILDQPRKATLQDIIKLVDDANRRRGKPISDTL